MRPGLISVGLWAQIAVISFCLSLAEARAVGAETTNKVEILLIWGTNAEKSPNDQHKAVDAEIAKKLKKLPLKWTNWFVVNRKVADLTPKGSGKIAISDKCEIEIKRLEGTAVEVSLFGKGEKVVNRRQDLPKGETVLIGGNAPDATSWFVVLRRIE